MDFNHLKSEIFELSQFPGMNVDSINEAVQSAGGNVTKLLEIYDKLMEDCYGDYNY